ncbi:MAG: hypothetical protein JW844_06165 [Candidatus Omnitrophica bacterium]|nr:hypothetical protein [Candidatus Omnitrophota bacterium]
MPQEKCYHKTLRRSLLVEILGEIFYKELASKTSSFNEQVLYQDLAQGERRMAELIRDELGRTRASARIPGGRFIAWGSRRVLRGLSQGRLKEILKKALRQQMYRRNFSLYHQMNPELWRSLLEHEEKQHMLLESVWNS